jgi:membrane protease YdiL (CAAX protease family)
MSLRTRILVSVIGLIGIGHVVAKYAKEDKDTAWIYVCLFYAGWIFASLFLLLKKMDVQELFGPVKNWQWGLVGLPFVFIAIYYVFIPNHDLLKWDYWLLLHLIICLVNPFMEEMYWRGLAGKFSNRPVYSYLFSTIAFATSHPLILGVNSPGVAGWIGFAGTFLVGSMLWLVFFKTRSLWLCVLIHFLIDFFGVAAYTLAGKAELMKLPF